MISDYKFNSGVEMKKRRPMRLEIATRKKQDSILKNSSTSSSSSSSSSSSPSVVAMSCCSTATTPMRLDSSTSPPQSWSPLHAALQQQQHQFRQNHHFDLAPQLVDMVKKEDKYRYKEEEEDSDVEMDGADDLEYQYHYHSQEATPAGGHMMHPEDVTMASQELVEEHYTVQWGDVLHQADILTCVFFFMDRRELLTRVRLVCKQWGDVCTGSTLLWHHHTFKDNPYYYTSKLSVVIDSDSAMVDEGEEDHSEPGDSDAKDGEQQQQERNKREIKISSSAQMYPTDKLMWHDHGDSVSMRRRNLRGTWTFLNYKQYFIEQCLLERCTTDTPDDANTSSGDVSTVNPSAAANLRTQGSGADVSVQQGKSELGPMFLEDKHAMSVINKEPPPPTYRHSLTVLPTQRDSENANYKHMYSDRSVADPMNQSDKVYLIGGLHNTMATQPPELAEDFVNVLEMVDNHDMTPTPSTPTSNALSSSTTSTPSSISSPLTQGLRRLLKFDSGISCGDMSGHYSSANSKMMSPFKRIQVVGKPPHIGKHTSVLFDNLEINGRHGPKILIFGGVENDQVTNSLYHFDLNTNTWFLEQFGPSELVPSARTNHAAVAVDDYMYIVGGGVGPNMVPTSEIWRYHVHLHRWEQVALTGDVDAFTPRLGMVVCAINHKIMIYGGGYWHQTSMVDRYWREKYRDLYILDTETNVLTKIDQSNNSIAPQVGTFPASVLIGTQWFIIGGAFDNKISHDIFALDTVTYRWRKFNQPFYGGDSLSCCHFVTSDHMNKLLILGGYCYSPLNNFQVFSLRYKDLMDAKHIFPSTVFHFHSGELEQQW